MEKYLKKTKKLFGNVETVVSFMKEKQLQRFVQLVFTNKNGLKLLTSTINKNLPEPRLWFFVSKFRNCCRSMKVLSICHYFTERIEVFYSTCII